MRQPGIGSPRLILLGAIKALTSIYRLQLGPEIFPHASKPAIRVTYLCDSARYKTEEGQKSLIIMRVPSRTHR